MVAYFPDLVTNDRKVMISALPILMMQSLLSAPCRMNNVCVLGRSAIQNNVEKLHGFRSMLYAARRPSKTEKSAPFIEVQDFSNDGWKLTPAIEMLRQAQYAL